MPEKKKNNNLPIEDKDIGVTNSANTNTAKPKKKPLTSNQKKMILKTIEIRLEGIGEATKRSRITFIVSIIACCSMLITIFNAYFSFTRERSFDNSFKYQAIGIGDTEIFFKELEDFKNSIDCESQKENAICGEISKFIENHPKYFQSDAKEKIPESELIVFRGEFLKLINETFLTKELYKVLNKKWIYDSFFPTEDKKLSEEEKITEGAKLIKKIEQTVFDNETSRYYNATNHFNKLIIEKSFSSIEWKAKVFDINNPVPLYEENKRALSREWLENQNVRINLLGISVNVDQFSLIGSFTLMVISVWMLFSSRRENRAIVSLLRDIQEETGKPDGRKDDSDEWDIANLTLHGIAHRLIFAQTGRNDLPMSEKEIFEGKYDLYEEFFNNITEIITKLIRLFSYALLLLPVISIGIILGVDYYTTTNTLFPYSNNPVEYFINRNTHVPSQISKEIGFGMVFGVMTFLVCISCLIFQKRTSSALREFEKQLGKDEKPRNSWWEEKIRPLGE